MSKTDAVSSDPAGRRGCVLNRTRDRTEIDIYGFSVWDFYKYTSVYITTTREYVYNNIIVRRCRDIIARHRFRVESVTIFHKIFIRALAYYTECVDTTWE